MFPAQVHICCIHQGWHVFGNPFCEYLPWVCMLQRYWLSVMMQSIHAIIKKTQTESYKIKTFIVMFCKKRNQNSMTFMFCCSIQVRALSEKGLCADTELTACATNAHHFWHGNYNTFYIQHCLCKCLNVQWYYNLCQNNIKGPSIKYVHKISAILPPPPPRLYVITIVMLVTLRYRSIVPAYHLNLSKFGLQSMLHEIDAICGT